MMLNNTVFYTIFYAIFENNGYWNMLLIISLCLSILVSRMPKEPTWYLVGLGWLGLFYYESSGLADEPRSGAYLYPDFSNAVVGLWMDHLLLQVDVNNTSGPRRQLRTTQGQTDCWCNF